MEGTGSHIHVGMKAGQNPPRPVHEGAEGGVCMGRVRYAVRRSHRRRRNSAGLQKALSCLLAAGYVASAVLLGVMISGKWLLPLARGGQEGQEAAEDAQPAESPSLLSALSQEEPQAELRLELPSIQAFAVAAGPFDSLEEANEKAVALMQRGGAGYVQAQGEQYLVLLCAYDAEESADKVAQRLDGDAGLTMQTLDVSSGTALLNVTASQSRGQRIQESYQTFTQALQALDDAWRQLDAGQTQTTDAVASAGALAAQLEQARAAAFEGTLIEGDAQALSDWDGCLSRCVAYLQTISGTDQSALAISAKIKYTYLACIAQYQSYIEGLLA